MIAVRGDGIVVNEPALVALDPDGSRVVAVGRAALEAAEKNPRRVRTTTPSRTGEVRDARLTGQVLQYFVTRVQGRQRLFRPDLMLTVSSDISSLERRSLTEAAISAGAKQVWLIDLPLAAAIGAELPISSDFGCAVCELRERGAEAALIRRSGVVASVRVPDRPPTAVAAALRGLVDDSEPALARNVRTSGIVLTGEGALEPGVGHDLERETGLPVRLAEEPQTCAGRGAAAALERFDVLKRDQLHIG